MSKRGILQCDNLGHKEAFRVCIKVQITHQMHQTDKVSVQILEDIMSLLPGFWKSKNKYDSNLDKSAVCLPCNMMANSRLSSDSLPQHQHPIFPSVIHLDVISCLICPPHCYRKVKPNKCSARLCSLLCCHGNSSCCYETKHDGGRWSHTD